MDELIRVVESDGHEMNLQLGTPGLYEMGLHDPMLEVLGMDGLPFEPIPLTDKVEWTCTTCGAKRYMPFSMDYTPRPALDAGKPACLVEVEMQRVEEIDSGTTRWEVKGYELANSSWTYSVRSRERWAYTGEGDDRCIESMVAPCPGKAWKLDPAKEKDITEQSKFFQTLPVLVELKKRTKMQGEDMRYQCAPFPVEWFAEVDPGTLFLIARVDRIEKALMEIASRMQNAGGVLQGW